MQTIFPNDIVQINEHHSEIAYVGCCMQVTEVHNTHISGFILVPVNFGQVPDRIEISCNPMECDRIGDAVMLPE